MSDIRGYENKVLEIKSIKEDEIEISKMPMDIYIQEAETLYHWSLDDKDKLVSKGIAEELINDLPVRSAILREAESKWQMERFGQEDLQKQWNDESTLAYKLRDELIHDFKFAFRKDNELLKKVSAINDGKGHPDMFQDLSDLSILGREYIEKLRAIGFDVSLLDKASETAKNLPALFGKVTNKKGKDTKKFRDQSYTYLKHAVDEIREHGQYIFWKDDERKKGYYSQHMKSRSAKKSTKNEKETEEDNIN